MLCPTQMCLRNQDWRDFYSPRVQIDVELIISKLQSIKGLKNKSETRQHQQKMAPKVSLKIKINDAVRYSSKGTT